MEAEGAEVPHTLEARYELGEKLGEGGYAVVKAGRSKLDGQEVAVKVLARSRMDAETEQGVRNEISLLQSLSHPNIVAAHDFFEEPDHFYVVMEKVSGGELFDRIVTKTFYTEKEARATARQILEGVKHCHDHHIAHRDLKPENLLMLSAEDDSSLKIVDFGFAEVARTPCLRNQCGTPGYIAPEILENLPHGTQVGR